MSETGQTTRTTRPQAQPHRIQFPEALTPPTTDRFLRINQVLEIIPVARSTWWKGVKEGAYPRGVKLSERTTAWRESEIQALIERLSSEARGAS
jgi:predicted DNA-binding transcriptional regulator AlpA